MTRLMITGAAGNLGGKLVAAFAGAPWCTELVAVDRPEALQRAGLAEKAGVRPLALDLGSETTALAPALAGIEAIIHFAVQDPMPDASWPDSSDSFGMNARLVLAARDAGVGRFVFASSNHAVGSLKEAAPLPPGSLTTDRVAPGTRFDTRDGSGIGIAYGASKALTEQLCLAAAQSGGLTTVSVRIGWCQPGENRPQTLNAGGDPGLSAEEREAQADPQGLTWFRNMWLSNRDFTHLFERAARADARTWPAPGIVVNGMSANAGMPWDIETTRRLLGYDPRDDVWVALKAPAGPAG